MFSNGFTSAFQCNWEMLGMANDYEGNYASVTMP